MNDVLEPSKKNKFLKYVFYATTIFILLFLGGFIVYWGIKQKPDLFGIKNTAPLSENEMLLSEIGNSIELPQDEKPTIATVTDLDKIKDQSFFKSAQVDDKVLVYPNSKKAYLYRPSTKKIIEVGMLNLGSEPVPTKSN